MQWCYGVDDQVVVDIRRWVRVELVDQVIAHLKDNPPPGCLPVPGIALQDPLEAPLKRLYDMRFTAPPMRGAPNSGTASST